MISFVAVLALLVQTSCRRAKKKAEQATSTAKAIIREKKSDISDKIVAHYDAYQPDTRFNKVRFTEFFHFSPTPDVREIYCHADEMGIDHDYQFTFYCKPITARKIIDSLLLNQRGPLDNNTGNGFWHPFPWWDSLQITKLQPWSAKGPNASYQYFWYDSSSNKAYYFSFDM